MICGDDSWVTVHWPSQYEGMYFKPDFPEGIARYSVKLFKGFQRIDFDSKLFEWYAKSKYKVHDCKLPQQSNTKPRIWLASFKLAVSPGLRPPRSAFQASKTKEHVASASFDWRMSTSMDRPTWRLSHSPPGKSRRRNFFQVVLLVVCELALP